MQDRICRFQCLKCNYKWTKFIEEYAKKDGKGPCPSCGSNYYKWLNFKEQ